MPYYCETMLNPLGTFPAEPINSLTSFAPVLFGLLALAWLIRGGDRGKVAYLLAVLTVATGIGSVAWHSMRTEFTLTIDYVPGLIYFVTNVVFWVVFLGSRWVALAIGAGFVFLFFGLPFADLYHNRLMILGGLIVIAAALLVATRLRRPAAFTPALAMVLAALVAAIARTADPYLCDVIPVGTHFLWHIFLGLAAYCGVRMMAALTAPPRAAPARD